MNQMPEGDGDEVLCHLKQKNADPGAIFAKVNQTHIQLFPNEFLCNEKNFLIQVNVNGDDAIPLYKYLKAQLKGEKGLTDVEWNFTKFLVDKNGKVVKRFHPKIEPNKIVDDIKNLM